MATIPAWKQLATDITIMVAAVSPLYYLILQLLRWERNAALDRREMRIDIEHLQNQMNDIQMWRSSISGLRLPKE